MPVPPVMKSDSGERVIILVKSETVNEMKVLETSTPLFEMCSELKVGRRAVWKAERVQRSSVDLRYLALTVTPGRTQDRFAESTKLKP